MSSTNRYIAAHAARQVLAEAGLRPEHYGFRNRGHELELVRGGALHRVSLLIPIGGSEDDVLDRIREASAR